MVHIGLFELGPHENNLYVLTKAAITGDDNVTIFTTESVAESVRSNLAEEASEITWIEKDNEESLRPYLRRVEGFCEQIDVLLIHPLYGGYPKLALYAMFDPPCRQALFVFNVRRWLDASYSLNHRPLRRNINIPLRRHIVRKSNALVMEYPPITEYIDEHFELSTPVHTLIPALFEGDQYVPDDPIRFTVPGQIESQRRNYDVVLDVFADLFEQFGDKIELQLLGTPRGEYGKRILSRCDEFVDAGYNLITYTDWIPIDEFESGLRRSHFILSPIRKEIKKGLVRERYGVSKGSGNVLDAIRTATPLIVPDHFTLADEIAEATITYQNRKELRERIESSVDDRDWRMGLQNQALEMSRAFTRDQQYEHLYDLVESV